MRLFLAAYPPATVVDAVRAVLPQGIDEVRWTAAEQWHVTLRSWVDADPDRLAERLGALDAAAVEARVGGRLRLLAAAAVVVGVNGLDDLARTVAARDEGSTTRPFHGHLTVGRLRRGRSLPRGLPTITPLAFAVEEIVLVGSELHPSGAIHRRLASFPLVTPPRRPGSPAGQI